MFLEETVYFYSGDCMHAYERANYELGMRLLIPITLFKKMLIANDYFVFR